MLMCWVQKNDALSKKNTKISYKGCSRLRGVQLPTQEHTRTQTIQRSGASRQIFNPIARALMHLKGGIVRSNY